MYLPLHNIKIPASNLRRSGVLSVLSFFGFLAVVIAHIFGFGAVEFYALLLALSSGALAILFLVPYIVGAVIFFLLPPTLYAFLDSPSLPILRQWWFWVVCVVAVLVGSCLLATAGKKYPKRKPR